MTVPPSSQDTPNNQTENEILTRSQHKQRLTELAVVFLQLGTIAFGGPAAHIAMMDREVVERRQWMTREKLLDLLGITNLLPGPNSTELAIHIGYDRAGWQGLLVAGSCFILPATLIVWAIAAIYTRYQLLPQLGWLLYGVKPIIIAIIFQAVWTLGKKAAKDIPTIIAEVLAMTAYLAGVNEIFILLSLGMAVMLLKNWHNKGQITGAFLLPLPGQLIQISTTTTVATTATTIVAVTWLQVFWFFLKIGCVLYGSGYVLLAFLQQELVDRQHWLTSQQLLDAIAIGQFTPGPVFTTATFVGYLLAGNAGAIAGTVGIFLPAFFLVWIVTPWVSQLRRSPWFNGFLDGVNAASLGLMAGVLFILGRAALVDWLTIGLVVGSAIVILRGTINSAWLMLMGAGIGLVAHLLKLVP